LAIVVEQQRKLHAAAAAASIVDVAPESLAEAVAVNAVVTLAPERRRRRPATPPPAPRESAPAAQAAAAAAAAAAPAPAAPTKQQQAQQKKQRKEDRNADARKAVCKVCNGMGRVSYENHMSQYDDRICPCCLVSPRRCVKRVPVGSCACGRLHGVAAGWACGGRSTAVHAPPLTPILFAPLLLPLQGKGRVRNSKSDLLTCLLSFDP
jgi:hypothetical protein